MILLVPYTPEVPAFLSPRLWQALVVVLVLGIAYLEVHDTILADRQYVDELQAMIETDDRGMPYLRPEGEAYLQLRPLLRIAPAKGDWDWKRLFYANFLHGSVSHLLLNLIGVFAGVRICSTFLPFWAIVGIYLGGGSLGLLVSTILSSEVSRFIPHVGSSAGIFALMGTYYVYNFRFRTRYFFWFPSRRLGIINLRTSWFFFVDVILLEIVLSTAQLFPNRLGNVDHLAHVVGFLAGFALAWLARRLQRWPTFLQTRGEYLYFRRILKPRGFDPVNAAYLSLLELLELNPYNDLTKKAVCRILRNRGKDMPEEELHKAFRFFSPTFIRLHTDEVASVVRALLARGRRLPEWWYKSTPYDSIIRIAKLLTQPVEEQYLLMQFISEYRKAHPEGSGLERKLELLMTKLQGMIPGASRAS